MAEYIDREKARNEACNGCTQRTEENGCMWPEPCGKLIEAFIDADPEDAVPVMRGKWKHVKTICGSEFVMCSKCGYKEHDHVKYTRFNYCPKCGAKMEG